MLPVLMYTKATCPFCIRAKELFKKKGVAFEEILIDGRDDLREEMVRRSSRKTVPQIWIGETHVGGCDDLFILEGSGKLDEMLERHSKGKEGA